MKCFVDDDLLSILYKSKKRKVWTRNLDKLLKQLFVYDNIF